MLKNLITSFLGLTFVLLIFTDLSAQTTERPNAFLGKRLWNDYQSLNDGDKITEFGSYGSGFELGYLRNMGRSFNFGIPFQLTVIDLPEDINTRTTIGIDAIGQFQLYQEGRRFIPYALVGVGGVLESFETLNFQIPVGIGANFRLGKYAFINAQASYRKSLTENRDNFQYGIGLGFYIGKIDEEPKMVNQKPKDRDRDGVLDNEDDCPDVPGVVAFRGCPDSDADGIADSEDDCPQVAGLKTTMGCPDADGDGFADDKDNCPNQFGKLRGCPDDDGDGIANNADECPQEYGTVADRGCPKKISDRDGDGFMDENDDCPDVAGSLRGCPDTDGDGFADRLDKCPNTAAPNTKDGCPEIKQEDREVLDYAVQAVQFEFSSARLKAISHPVLDQVKGVLDKYPDYRLQITGHTDSVGDPERNETLSLRRADACFKYLVSKGVRPNRITVTGRGENHPIADNNTEEGRSLNRRVEFLVVPGG